MGKRTTIAMCVLVVGLLAGCAVEGGEPVGEVAEPEAPAFHFASGTLELGDFDPDTLGDDLFDPCTEISAEEYAAAGITGVESLEIATGYRNPDTNSCRADELRPKVSRMVTATKMNEEMASGKEGVVLAHPDSVVDGLFTQMDPAQDPFLCVAQVDTTRGSIGVGIAERGAERGRNDTCRLATENLERLFGVR